MSGCSVIDADGSVVTPQLVLEAYRQRCFPMADQRSGRLRWYRPQRRAIITWDRWKIPESLAKRLRHAPFTVSFDRAFTEVMAACAERKSTWISGDIELLYNELHRLGSAHSVEAWNAAGELVGGLYGLNLGGCFCGESMFHRADDAGKVCVVHLVERLRAQGFTVLDCQQQSPHMERFGAYEIDDAEYASLLERCQAPCAFTAAT
jgi:leucyl/phenylalanyl-tRNA---protein transferase